MKRCPICDKTFADGMKFCQTDGTLLIDDAPPEDPYKTVVGNQSDIASAIPPVDPFKTMIASPPPKPGDVLDLPEENIDSLKTMVVSPDEMKAKSSEAENVPKLDLPPPVPIIEPKVATPTDSPKSNEPSLSPPSFGDLSAPESDLPQPSAKIEASKFDSKSKPNDFSTQSPYGNQENKPIPSPFDGSMIGYMPPAAPPPLDTTPKTIEKELEPMYGSGQQESPNQSPFQSPTPFGSPEPHNQPMQQSDWTPPPAPVSEWGNQDLGANTPFQPPPAAGGQDQTLAIVSLVCGVLSILCCGLLAGIPAIITGFMAKGRVDSNPAQYTGRGMAIAGIILGGISIVLTIIIVILQVALGAFGRF